MTTLEAPAQRTRSTGDEWFFLWWRGLRAGSWHAEGGHQHFFCGPEQALLVIGPPRSKKTSAVVVPNLWGAPAAAVSTSTKPDVLAATLACRRELGTCWVFDPTGSTALPEGAVELRWSPLVGSAQWDGAVAMARALVRAARPHAGAHPEAQHWVDRAEALLAPLLHAAAASGRSIAEVCRWTLSHDVREPEALLRQMGAPLATVSLSSVWRTEERERSGIFSTAASLLSVYRSTVALEPAKAPNFDPERFAASRDTLYICAPGSAQDQLAPLVVALLEQVKEACYLRRRRHPDSAPTLFLLDEVANIAPLPGLARLVSEGASQGVVTLACLQDLSQARARWGAEAEGFFSLFGAKLIFPGVADGRTLELVSALAGEQQVHMRSVTRPAPPTALQRIAGALAPRAGIVPNQTPIITESVQFRPRLPVEEVYRGRPGYSLVISGSTFGYVPLEPCWALDDLEQESVTWSRLAGAEHAGAQWWPPSPYGTVGPRLVPGSEGEYPRVVGGTPLPNERVARPTPPAANGEAPRRHGPTGAPEPLGEEERKEPTVPIALPSAKARELRGYTALVKVIGPPELLGGLEAVERGKPLELACALALHGHRLMTNEELRCMLWPGELGEAEAAAKSLRNTASLLRRALGPDLFPEARKGLGYGLGPEVGCDATIISELVDNAGGAEEAARLQEALTLVRGVPFEGVKPGTYSWVWTEHLVSVIERTIRSAAYRLCELSLEGGDHEKAMWAALQALVVDRYDRKLWELYLTASAAAGRHALEQAWKEARGALGTDASDLM